MFTRHLIEEHAKDRKLSISAAAQELLHIGWQERNSNMPPGVVVMFPRGREFVEYRIAVLPQMADLVRGYLEGIATRVHYLITAKDDE